MTDIAKKAGAAIDARIKVVATNATKLNDYAHETAVAIVEHAKEHGDCTRSLKLVNDLPKSHRRGLLVLWFARCGIRVDVTKGTTTLYKDGSKMFAGPTFNLDWARITPFFAMPEAEKEQLDLTAGDVVDMINKLVKRLSTKLEEGKVAANDVEAVTRRRDALRVALAA